MPFESIIISVIVPVYNVEKYLHKCLESISNQTFKFFECILIDDASLDGSSSICDEFANNDVRFKVIHKKQNEGCPLARKTGLDNAQGEYIIYIDSDDWIENTMLEKLYNKGIMGGYDLIYCDIFTYHDKLVKCQNFENINNILLIKEWFTGNFISSVINKLVKINIYKKIQFPSFFYDEDCVICIQLLYYAQKTGYVNEALYHTTLNENSFSHDINRKINNINEQATNMCQIYSFLFKVYNENIIFFEPELSARINNIKHNIFLSKELRYSNHDLLTIYPNANKKIFNPALKLSYKMKILLKIAAKNILFPYLIYDFYYSLKNRFHSIFIRSKND